ncbi:MAG: hypothetical protein ABIZ81_18095 [Opitutaceae bacterium]
MSRTIRVGPSWTEVFLGAFLALALGIALGALSLILKPVVAVKELPKEADRVANAVYYIAGSRDANKGPQAESKRKNFAAGQSVSVNEDELNLLTVSRPPAPAPAPKPKAKAKAGELPLPQINADATVLPPKFRIRDGVMQIAVPTTVSVMGFGQTMILLAKGDFAREDGRFVFVPASMTIGSCPLNRFPFAKKFALKQLLGSQPFPEDVAASWGQLVAVRVEGSELKLTMP